MAEPPIKFVKSIESDMFDYTAAFGSRWLCKLIYEFWAFVVNGGDNPLTSGSGFATAGGLNFPSGFFSSSHLLAVGTDGQTSFGSNTFFSPSTNFQTLSGSLRGKYLVMWKSGSTSFDDGIYKISFVESTNRLTLDPTTGGTPRRGNHATFWDRSQIRFRIVDFDVIPALAWSDQHGMTLQFDGASDVNPGQRTSQFHFQLQQTQQYFASMSISPSGTWNVNHFTDSGSNISVRFFNSTANSGRMVVSLAGSKDFLTCHVKGIDDTMQGAGQAGGAGFHVEIPKRLYPPLNDPNPITFMAYGGATISQITGTYHTGFRMIGADGVQRTWTTLVRSPYGDHTNANLVAFGAGVYQGLTTASLNSVDKLFNEYTSERLMSDAVLHLNQASQFSLARVRLRHVRFSTPRPGGLARPGNRFGSEWINFSNGILWPWNNTTMPYGFLPWEGV